MRGTILLPAILMGTALFAGPVTLSVDAPTYAGQHIQLYGYADYFTLWTELLAEGELDAQGVCSLTADVEGTRKAVIRIGPVGADLYLRAGSYHLRIPAPAAGEALPIGGTTRVDPEFPDLPALDVNALVSDMNERLDGFLAQDLATDNNAGMEEVAKVRAGKVKPVADTARGPRSIFTGPQWNAARTDTFAQKLQKFYAGVDDPWFQRDVEYGLAGLYLGPRDDDRELFDRYLKDRPVLYNVPEYVRFFSNFYAGYMMRFGYAKDPDKFLAAVRGGRTDSLKAILARNDFMRAPRVNELVLITGLYAEHGNKQFDPPGALAVLKDVAASSSFPENRTIAGNMVRDLTTMKAGAALPPLPLRTATGAPADLTSALSTGPVCLFVTTPRCIYCDQELAALTQLQTEYGGYATFINILAPANEADLHAWLKEHPETKGSAWYSTTRVNELLDRLRLKSIPAVFLLQDGSLTAAPGPLPSQGLKAVLYSIKAKADEKQLLKPDRGLPPPRR